MTGAGLPGPSANQPLVSIITPTLNQAPFIAATLASVERQSYTAIEHIVVDGGSTDGTQAILEAWAHQPRRSWSSGRDRGMYDAVNAGMARAHGEVLAYLNSDDVLLPWAVEVVVDLFATLPDVDLIVGDAILVDEAGHLTPMLQVPIRPWRLMRFGALAQPAVFWRRRLAERIGPFDGALRFVGDLDYWLRASRQSRCTHVDEMLAVARDHGDTMTRRHRSAMRAEEQAVRGRHHKDGRAASVRRLIARAWYEVAVRQAWVRFARAVRSRDARRWAEFQAVADPRVDVARLAAACLPLAGRLLRLDWLGVRSDAAWVTRDQRSSS